MYKPLSDRATYIWIIALTLTIFLGGWIMFSQHNILSKSAIENVVGNTLGVKVTIGELHMNLDQGTARLGHVMIFNPRHFSDGPAMEIENIDVWIDTWSRGLIKFKEIAATGVQANLEVQPTRDNLDAITERMRNKKDPLEMADVEKLKIIIDELSVRGARLRPRFVLLDKHYSTILAPDIEARAIGYAENGILARDAIKSVWLLLEPDFSKTAEEAGFKAGMAPTVKMDESEEERKAEDRSERLISE